MPFVITRRALAEPEEGMEDRLRTMGLGQMVEDEAKGERSVKARFPLSFDGQPLGTWCEPVSLRR